MADRRSDTSAAAAIVGFGVLSTVFWAASHIAALLAGGDFDGDWGQAPIAAARLLADRGDPAGAWRAAPDTFGSTGVFWCITGASLLLTGGVLVGLWLWLTKATVGIDRSERLGMVPEARMATKTELAPLRVRRPVPGRFVFGRVGRDLVATEDPTTQTPRQIRDRAKTRVGDRTSVMMFGPTRSGKTATIIPGIIEWDLPAVISSVKDDIMQATFSRRLRIGDVYLFDPFKVVAQLPEGVQRVSWSPISCSHTIDGAIDAAQNLADAAGSEDLTSGGFWSDRGASLLWPLLFAASIAGRSMTDIGRWLANQDGTEGKASEVTTILTDAIAAGGSVGRQAAIAVEQFQGWVNLDPRPRSDVNSTAQSLVSCWNSVQAAASSDPRLPAIDIGKILCGRNTLYIVQPLGRGDQYAALFGGLFGDLIRDQTYRVAHAGGQRIGPLLAVLDEAANTPLRWLPEVASTCAGIGVQLCTIWQDRAQVDALYKEHAQSLLNNHATKVFFAGQSDPATLEYASMLCGDEEVTSNSASADLDLGSSRRTGSAQTVAKRLVPPEMLRLIPNGTAMLIHNTLRPCHMTGRRLNEEPDHSQRHSSTEPEPLVISGTMKDAFSAAQITLDDEVLDYVSPIGDDEANRLGATAQQAPLVYRPVVTPLRVVAKPED